MHSVDVCVVMAPAARGGASKKRKHKQTSLASTNVLPMLNGPAKAIGKDCLVPGAFWQGCPEGDKKKKYKCTITDFDALHTWDKGGKSAAFQLKEMGESGTGSLEPGIASGDSFFLAYPAPFLQYYYDANPGELPEHMHPATEIEISGSETPAADSTDGKKERRTKHKDDPEILKHLTQVSSTMNMTGSKRGCYTNKYTCNIVKDDGCVCGSRVTLYKSAEGNAYQTSNAWAHLRDVAESDQNHKIILGDMDGRNPKRTQDKSGNSVPMLSFSEAFPHHVDYVFARARGIFGANTGKKPEFRKYVRGAFVREGLGHAPLFGMQFCLFGIRRV